ncbi:MAG: magnesium chelatase subunit D [Paracoccaceae bacterium]
MTLHPSWQRAELALTLLAIDPAGLGGIWLRARSGPVRDRLVAALAGLPLPCRKIHPAISDEQLFGGVDLSNTLNTGKVVYQEGILARATALVMPMAERTSSALSARLSAALDKDTGHCLIALDEGVDPEETLPSALVDRLALHLDLDDVPWLETREFSINKLSIAHPVGRLHDIVVPDSALADMTSIAVRLGIDSLRAPLLGLRAAKAHAALCARGVVTTEDLKVAAELVLGPRATQMPEPPADDMPPDQPEPDTQDAPEQSKEQETVDGQSEMEIPQEVVLEAVKALLPADLLARIAASKAPKSSSQGGGAGAKKKSNRRGRPIPSRQGRLDGTSKIDLIATLRAAAPWQAVRAKMAPHHQALHIRTPDIRTKRFEEKSDRLLIFVVDASGSAAVSRLAEAKGAVELLLAEAYARRDHVALIAFRGIRADLLLPPTRSLVQTKRRLCALPGGGGTPLASGLKVALELAMSARGKGMTPTVALLTDGRANIALDGTANRKAANDDAELLARSLRSYETPALVIDMGARPTKPLEALARTMHAPYIALPRADAQRLSSAVSAAIDC